MDQILSDLHKHRVGYIDHQYWGPLHAKGIINRIDQVVTNYRAAPDDIQVCFELSVLLSYVPNGYYSGDDVPIPRQLLARGIAVGDLKSIAQLGFIEIRLYGQGRSCEPLRIACDRGYLPAMVYRAVRYAPKKTDRAEYHSEYNDLITRIIERAHRANQSDDELAESEWALGCINH
jgi:hypothetical protein